jgi:hypothetical protein
MLLGVVVFRSKISNVFDKRASIGLIFGLSICAVFFLKTYYKWSTCEISESVKDLPAREISIDLIVKQIKFQKLGNNGWKKQYVGKITNAPNVRVDLIDKAIKLTGVKIHKGISLGKGDILRVKGLIKEDCSFLCCTNNSCIDLGFHFSMYNVKIIKIIKSDVLSFWQNLRTGIKQHLNINKI